jgi:L-ascorbate metabolism protein UlaG (beta-lactamase superfamily)
VSDPHGAVLDWYGCAPFRLKPGGKPIFLDAYIDRAEGAEGPGLMADDVTEADWILVGHSHFDHLYGAERIAANTGATIIGSYETIRVMEQAGVPLDQMICVSGGETVQLGGGPGDEDSPSIKVSVFPSLHSCVWSHAEMEQPDRECLGDLGVTWQERQARFAKLVEFLNTGLGPEAITHFKAADQGDRGDGGALVFVIETPDGTIFYQDTSGHWTGILDELPEVDVAILAAAGRGNIDGDPIQGSLSQFVVRQAELLQPKKVVLGHHDNWLPGFSVATSVGPIRDALNDALPDTELLEPGYLAGTELF